MSASSERLVARPGSPCRDGDWSHEVPDKPLQNRIWLYDAEADILEIKKQKDGFVGEPHPIMVPGAEQLLTLADGIYDLDQMQRCFVEPGRKELALYTDVETKTRISKAPNEGGLSHMPVTMLYLDRVQSTVDRLARSVGGLRYLYVKTNSTLAA